MRSGSSWSQRGGALTAIGGAANDSFGYSVALDGDIALIGAPYRTVGSNADQGAAYIFMRSGSAWSQQGGALTTTTSRDGSGYSVALARGRALIGSPLDFVGKNIQGSAYVFVRSGSTWSQQGGALATANDGVHDYFGSTVALSGDTALIGAPYHKVGSNADQGARLRLPTAEHDQAETRRAGLSQNREARQRLHGLRHARAALRRRLEDGHGEGVQVRQPRVETLQELLGGKRSRRQRQQVRDAAQARPDRHVPFQGVYGGDDELGCGLERHQPDGDGEVGAAARGRAPPATGLDLQDRVHDPCSP